MIQGSEVNSWDSPFNTAIENEATSAYVAFFSSGLSIISIASQGGDLITICKGGGQARNLSPTLTATQKVGRGGAVSASQVEHNSLRACSGLVFSSANFEAVRLASALISLDFGGEADAEQSLGRGP